MTSLSIPSYLYYLESLNLPLRIDLPKNGNLLSRSGTPTVPKATCHSPIYDWSHTNEKDMIQDLVEIEELISFDLSFHSYSYDLINNK